MENGLVAANSDGQDTPGLGIGAMTRMVAKAYRMADAIRSVGVPVVMGGPHVTEEADEALGRDGGPRHADAVALGEADETWPTIVNDAARGKLRDVYAPVDADGKQKKRVSRNIQRSLGIRSILTNSISCQSSSSRCWIA